MTELPKGWAKVTVGDVATSMLGKMLDKSKGRGTLAPYLRNQNVRWDSIDLSDVSEMRFEDDENGRFGLIGGDLLICEGGEPGRAAIWDGSISSMKFQKALHRVRPSPALVPRLLLYRLRSDATTGNLEQYFTGTTIKHFTGVALNRYEFPLPPLNEQRRIVEKLDAVFEKSRAAKARLERLPALLDQLKRSILAAAFRGDLTKGWRAANPNVESASVLLDRIRAERRRKWEEALRAKGKDPKKATYEEPAAVDTSKLPELPEGWAWALLNDIAGRVTDGTHQTPEFVSDGVPFVFVRNIVDGALDLRTEKFVSLATYTELTRRCAVERGDILYSAVGSYGIAVTVETDEPFTFQRHIAHIKPEPQLRSEYLAQFLNSPFGRAQADERARGVAQKTVTLGELSTFLVAVAPRAEQEAICETVRKLLAQNATLASRIEATAKAQVSLEQAALSKAFRGELVPQDPTDEPAEVLLERLRSPRAAAPVARRTDALRTAPTTATPTTDTKIEGEPVERIIAVLRQTRRQSTSAIADATGLDAADVRAVLKSLERLGKVAVEGKARGTTYVWVE